MEQVGTDFRIAKVAVVIPVHNEEQHLGRALGGVRAAADALQSSRPGLDLAIVVVLDSCTDNSSAVAARIAASDPRVSLCHVAFRSVGRSRRAGIRTFLNGRHKPGAEEGIAAATTTLWLANTDADSHVPEDWLVRQVMLADRGADAVLGTVEPDAAGMDGELLRRWHLRHTLAEDHPHVFGANLGVRASAYLLAGGFPRQRSHEDRVLVDRLRRRGFSVTSTDTVRVLTSGRTEGRAPHGLGAYLLALRMESAVALES
jgi:glycosyltransferase involved in cell wall biosynthesis